MKRFKTILALFIVYFGISTLLISCGASSGGGSSGGTNTLAAYIASPAPNTGASCILRDSAGDTISGPIISSNGQVSFIFSADIPNSWMTTLCTGGTYTNVATQNPVIVPSETKLRNAFYYQSGTTTSIVVSPLTEIAYQNIIGYIYQNYPAQLAQVTTILGLGTTDVSSLQPTDIGQIAAGTDAAGQYGILMAALSEMMKDQPLIYPDIETLITTLVAHIKDGAIDNTSNTIKADLLVAMNNLTTNTFVGANVQASMAGMGGSQYTTLSNGNSGGTLVATVYGAGSVSVKQAYSSLIATATGGTPPYHFQLDTLLNGSPPLGMSVDLNGYLTGTPTVAGTYTFGVCAIDLVATSSCKTTVITVLPETPPSASNGDYYYHWNCNGDEECLTTNSAGTPTGTTNLGPGAGGQSGCNSLLTFAAHFWGDAATSTCDQSPN